MATVVYLKQDKGSLAKGISAAAEAISTYKDASARKEEREMEKEKLQIEKDKLQLLRDNAQMEYDIAKDTKAIEREKVAQQSVDFITKSVGSLPEDKRQVFIDSIKKSTAGQRLVDYMGSQFFDVIGNMENPQKAERISKMSELFGNAVMNDYINKIKTSLELKQEYEMQALEFEKEIVEMGSSKSGQSSVASQSLKLIQDKITNINNQMQEYQTQLQNEMSNVSTAMANGRTVQEQEVVNQEQIAYAQKQELEFRNELFNNYKSQLIRLEYSKDLPKGTAEVFNQMLVINPNMTSEQVKAAYEEILSSGQKVAKTYKTQRSYLDLMNEKKKNK